MFKMACEGKEHTDFAREKYQKLDIEIKRRVGAIMREGLEARRVYEGLERNDFARIGGESFFTSLPFLIAKSKFGSPF